MTLSVRLAAALASVLLVAALTGAPAGASAGSDLPATDPTGFEPVAGAVFNDPTGTNLSKIFATKLELDCKAKG